MAAMDRKAGVDLIIVHNGNRLITRICLPTCLYLAMPNASPN